MKRAFDAVISCVGLLIFSPLFALVAMAVKLDSPGPVFFRGWRAGLQGKPFRIFKFRTMAANVEMTGGTSTAVDDPRITRLGNVLRRSKFDEVPELINVFRGEMSLVWPRPQVMDEVLQYTPEKRHLMDVLPGITDWASIKFRHKDEILRGGDPDRAYRERIRAEKVLLGLEYVRCHSFPADLRILMRTLRALFD
jgi:lipopolysaccharide/colanic/teichoic acid biosynthesis glycosyltransferase